MRKLMSLLMFLWSSLAIGQAFITTWNTADYGISQPHQITIPTTGSGYNYSIYWEDTNDKSNNGTIPGPITGSYTISFPSGPGIYRISITGSFPRIFFNEQNIGDLPSNLTSDARKIHTVEQWGNIVWTSMANAFQGCQNLSILAKDAPNLTQVLDMSYMFHGVSDHFNQPIDHWDVSHVTDMHGMFLGAEKFNQPLGNWNVSNITDMFRMFYGASSFNQPLADWDVSNVLNMSAMFMFAGNFNQPIGLWDVSHVLQMNAMFNKAGHFNQPLDLWDVSSVQYMNIMFTEASRFNQSLGNWNITKVIEMYGMLNFSGIDVANYDQTLIGWASQNVLFNVGLGADGLKYCAGEAARTSLITEMNWAIDGDSKVNRPLDISIIQPICRDSTGTIIVVNSDNGYGQYSFDNGITFQSANTKTGLQPGSYTVIHIDTLSCTSTTMAIVNSPLSLVNPVISGSPIVCPNITEVDYSASIQDYSYSWFIDGGVLQSQQNNSIKVNWGPSNFNASVKTIGYDQHNCPTDNVTFPVKIQIQLKPEIIQGMDSVCYNFRTGVPYQATNTNGSVYTWFTNGGVVSEGQSTSFAKIDWMDIGQYALWVKEENTTSTDYCEGYSDTLNVTVFKDLAAITMNFVSVDYRDDKKVQIQWDATLLERISDLIIVSRRKSGSGEPWQVVATLQKNVQSFLDQDVLTDQNVYEYKVEGFNKCDEGLQTVIHNTIKLAGDKVEEQALIDLFWNDYNGWDSVERYEIWRKLDGDTTYRLMDVTSGSITNYIGKHGADGFVHVLRVKAKKKNENTISWSNEIELDFENPIDFIPNVITPNGDTENEYFVIPKLNLYPDNYLKIINRWGETVYEKRNYSNDWNANGLTSGTYYYSLHLARNNKIMNGWVQVMR